MNWERGSLKWCSKYCKADCRRKERGLEFITEELLAEDLDNIFVMGVALYADDVTGAPYREVNSRVATAPKLKVEDKDRVNNSRRIKTLKLNIVKLKASLNKFSRGKVGSRSRMPNA